MEAQREALEAIPQVAARQISELPMSLGGAGGRLGLAMGTRLALGLAG